MRGSWTTSLNWKLTINGIHSHVNSRISLGMEAIIYGDFHGNTKKVWSHPKCEWLFHLHSSPYEMLTLKYHLGNTLRALLSQDNVVKAPTGLRTCYTSVTIFLRSWLPVLEQIVTLSFFVNSVQAWSCTSMCMSCDFLIGHERLSWSWIYNIHNFVIKQKKNSVCLEHWLYLTVLDESPLFCQWKPPKKWMSMKYN